MPRSLELLEARQEIAALRAELKRALAAERRLRWYVKTQMGPLSSENLRLHNKVLTLERRLKRMKGKT